MSEHDEFDRRHRGGLQSTLGRELAELSLTPLRMTMIYLAFGSLALYVSDVMLVRMFSDPRLQRLQTVKGALEVLVTGGLIYGLTYASRASLRRRTDELHRQREELRVLHRLLRHDLRNQLTVLQGQARQLRKRLASPAQEVTCESLLETVDDIIEFTEQAQEIRKLTASTERTTVDLASLVPRLLSATDHGSDRVDVTTSLPDAAEVEVSEQFGKALAELVDNAIVHNESDRPGVSISVDPGGGRAGMTRITVADDGPGLPEHVERVIAGGQRDDLVHLDGLGLWFVYLTTIESGGTFRIVSSDDEGTTIELQVPTAGDPGLGRRLAGSATPLSGAATPLAGAAMALCGSVAASGAG